MSDESSVSEHAAKLSQFISELWQQGIVDLMPMNPQFRGVSFTSVCEWLDLAKSIMSVKTNTTAYDASGAWFMCGPAMEYADRRDKFLDEATLRISRFTFLWSALECFLKNLGDEFPEVPKKIRKKSSLVERAVYYIKINETDELRKLCGHCYDRELAALAREFMLSDSSEKAIENMLSPDEFKSSLAIGLNVVRMARNSLAHGTHEIPEDEEYGGSCNEDYFNFLDSICSSVLFSMQIILIIYLGRKGEVTYIDYQNDEVEFPVIKALAALHGDKLSCLQDDFGF
ncbi:hypothetical protein [Marinobacter sp. F4218]|uniref:hypothetical protein n=1 Tax=Marinobacter sp. F4218 TaxID=2862868 RepID=UPI001C62FF89|nr:hypothetical protein [Marinobacter sp. F4218]MBW7472316.1 hypothetical protein [Marinobacter sp. F4218]